MLPSGLSSLAQASALLDVSVQALEDTRDEGLQPADMMSLIQLLSLTADVPSQPFTHDTNYSQDNIQELSQHFISLADSIISEEDTLKWQAIKEVVHTEWLWYWLCVFTCSVTISEVFTQPQLVIQTVPEVLRVPCFPALWQSWSGCTGLSACNSWERLQQARTPGLGEQKETDG